MGELIQEPNLDYSAVPSMDSVSARVLDLQEELKRTRRPTLDQEVGYMMGDPSCDWVGEIYK